MDRTDWALAVVAFQEAYPGQAFDDPTMKLWFRALEGYTREEIARALLRCLREREWLSSYALAEAVKEDRRERSVGRSTVTELPPRGVPMPPETREAIAALRRSTLLPDHPDYLPSDQARARADELAGYLDARQAEQTMAPRRERPA